VQASAGHLADRPEAGHGGASGGVGEHAAHVVVGGGADGQRLGHGVDPGSAALGRHGGEQRGELDADGVPGVQEHPAAALELGEHRARDDVAGGERVAQQGAPVRGDQDRALAADRLADQRHRVEAADVEGGGVELHHLKVPEDGAGAGGEDEPLPVGAERVRGVGVQAAHTASCQDGAGGGEDGAQAAALDLDAGDGAVGCHDAGGAGVLEHGDGRDAGGHGRERPHDLGARGVPVGVDDAAAAVGAFEAELERSGGGAVERDALADEPVDRGGGGGGDGGNGVGIAEARAGGEGVGGVERGIVAGGDGGRDPALRPAGGGLAVGHLGEEGARREQDAGLRGEAERGGEAGQAGADDDGHGCAPNGRRACAPLRGGRALRWRDRG